jgi:diguanylate cyclase (GGDEF)-like protein
MKQSIRKIFDNIILVLIFTTLFSAFASLIAVDHNGSYVKINNLKNQKNIISKIVNLEQDNLDIMLIQLHGKSTQIKIDVDKLYDAYTYNFTEQYIIDNSAEYIGDINILKNLTAEFTKKASEYYNKNLNISSVYQELLLSADTLNKHIDSMIFKNIIYDEQKFNLHKMITWIAFGIIFITTLWYRKKLNVIYKDIEFLGSINRHSYETYSDEAETISLRMQRKPSSCDNLLRLDPVTGINNYRGMISCYSEKKGMRENNFISVSILEIDNFSKSDRTYSQEFTQAVLKKVAFTISLHEQVTDIIARTDYNQFTIILSRPRQEQCFKDIDIIRQSIAEMKVTNSGLGPVEITVSGGFSIKPKNITIDEAIKKTGELLEHAKNSGGDRIFQVKDLAKAEL